MPYDFFLMVQKFFDKNTACGGVRNKTMTNQELGEELYKPII